MQAFQDLFMNSRGKPIDYKGKTVRMFFDINLSDRSSIKLILESTNSLWCQGIELQTEGQFKINGQIIEGSVVFWQDTFPGVSTFDVLSKNNIVSVKNVWKTGDGTVHSWHNGAAMIVEQKENSYTFFCNDGVPDDDFDDIIFKMEIF